MIVRRIKPRAIPRPSRAKALISYAAGKTHTEQIRLLTEELRAVERCIADIDSDHAPGEAADLLRYAQVLSDSLHTIQQSPIGSIDRASALASYALRLSDRVGAVWSVIDGVPGWHTGEAFYSGVTSPHAAEREMAFFATQARRDGHPIDHLVFSWQSHERPTIEQMLYAANRALSGSGVPRDCPRVLAIHDDTENLHVHVVLSRYRPAINKVWSCGNWIDKLHHATRRVEIELGFAHDNGNSVVIEQDGKKLIADKHYKSALLSASASSMERRLGMPSFERYIRENRRGIERLAEASSDWQQLHHELAMNYGIGLKRHGKGLVISDLSHAKGVHVKASTAGLGAPTLDARIGPWVQLTTPLAHLRRSASNASTSYAQFLGACATPEPSLVTTAERIDTERRARQRRSKERLEQIEHQHTERIQEAYEQTSVSNKSADRRRKNANKAAALRALAADTRAAIARSRAQIKLEYLSRKRTPLALGEPTIHLMQSGTPAVAFIGVRVLVAIQMPGYETRQLRDRVEYWRGGAPVLIDDGEWVTVLSNVSADIQDAVLILLQRSPDTAERGIIVTGSDEFRHKAMHVIAWMGLDLANQDAQMQADFKRICSRLSLQSARQDNVGRSLQLLARNYPTG